MKIAIVTIQGISNNMQTMVPMRIAWGMRIKVRTVDNMEEVDEEVLMVEVDMIQGW